MRKRKKGRKLSRKRDQRRALLKSLARSLILKERILTSEAKAKELRSFLEPLITKSKKGDLDSRRYLLSFFSAPIVEKLIKEIGPRYQARAGGYTKIIKLGARPRDGAKMAFIELVK